jgi:hypothetical protein
MIWNLGEKDTCHMILLCFMPNVLCTKRKFKPSILEVVIPLILSCNIRLKSSHLPN